MAVHNAEFDTNFEILRENMISERQEHQPLKRNGSQELRSVEEIPHPYQEIFFEFSNFNAIQSRVIDDVLYSDDSLVVSAPTGSGKTVVFELAIVRLLISLEHNQFSVPFKIVYICPMKAICEERLVDWHKKFSNFGINAIAVTGDSEHVEFKDLLNHNLIITTPEKWDCLTRKWRENIKLVRIVKLFMIDEVHLLNEETRGSTLEAIICRMKTIEKAINTEENDNVNRIRFLAASATVPNIEDVAEWLGVSSKCHRFSDSYRPVKLNKIVLGYTQTQKVSHFKFDLSLNYKLRSLIMQHSHGKPTLIFCSTRKIVEMTAKHVLQHLTLHLEPEQKHCLLEASASVVDGKIKESLIHGVGYHHAGMLPQTKRVIESLFRNGDLPILVTTSTLSLGVNLPAHLVIVKSTKCYSNGGFQDYTETAILQMIGRAGRPQFDTEGTALILTSAKDKEKFEKMIGGLQPVESDLHRHLIEHLNAEVVLQTITDLEVAMRWLSSTFLYIRARKNPRYYGLPSSDPSSIDRRLLEMCQIELNKLIKAGMITIDQDVLLRASPVGAAMARYYLFFETMKLFTQITGKEILQQILSLISQCYEFSEMHLRVNDKKCLNLLNKCRDRQTIRFPLNGKIKTLDMKINCIIQAVLGCLDISDHSLFTEALKIMRNGERIVKCLIEYLESKDKCFQALLNTIIVVKCFHVKLWENSPYVSKQLPGIGNVSSSQLVNAGKTTFQAILDADPREIEVIINKKPPVGSKMQEQILHLPKYSLRLEPYGKNKVKLVISLENASDLGSKCTVNRNSLMFLLVGDSCNNVLLYEKYSHSFLIESPDVVRFIDFQEAGVEELEAHFISEDWVGIDCTTKLEVAPKPKDKKNARKTPKAVKKNPNDDLTYMQKFMEMYMNGKKNKDDQGSGAITNSTNDEGSLKENDQSKNILNESTNNKIIIHGNVTIFDKDGCKSQKSDSVPRQKLKCIENIGKVLTRDTPSLVSKDFQTDESALLSQNPGFSSSSANLDKGENLKKKFGWLSKQWTHKRSMEENDESNTSVKEASVAPPSKRRDLDEKYKSSKITWRSPLTYSPPVKFSPKVICNPLSVSVDQNSLASPTTSTATPNRDAPSTKKTKLSTSFRSTPLKLNSSQKLQLPLSDKACADSSLDDMMRSDIQEKIGDLVCTSFLESFGLMKPPKQKMQSQVKAPNEYYRQLVTQSEESVPGRKQVGEGIVTGEEDIQRKEKVDDQRGTEKGEKKLPEQRRSTQSRFFDQSGPSTSALNLSRRSKLPIPSPRPEKTVKAPQILTYSNVANKENQFPSSSSRKDSFPKHVSHQSDVFNDSLDSVLMECNMPSPLMRSDHHDRVISRRNSKNFANFEAERSRGSFFVFEDNDEGARRPETPPNDVAVRDDHLADFDDAFDDDMSLGDFDYEPEDCAPLREVLRPNPDYQFTNCQYRPEQVYNNYQIPPYQNQSPHQLLPFSLRTSSNSAFTPYPLLPRVVKREYSYAPDELYFTRHYDHPYYKKVDYFDDGYGYIRHAMEKENDPFLGRGTTPDPIRIRGDLQSPRVYPERIPMQNHFPDVAHYNYDTSMYRSYNNPPHMERHVNIPPPLETFPDLAASYAERRQYYQPPFSHGQRNDYPRTGGHDKNYVMRKFFGDMDRK